MNTIFFIRNLYSHIVNYISCYEFRSTLLREFSVDNTTLNECNYYKYERVFNMCNPCYKYKSSEHLEETLALPCVFASATGYESGIGRCSVPQRRTLLFHRATLRSPLRNDELYPAFTLSKTTFL